MRLLDIYLPHEPRLPMKLGPIRTQQQNKHHFVVVIIRSRKEIIQKRNVVEHEKMLY